MAEETTQPILDKAIAAVKAHFTNVRGDPIKTPYYLSQLEILYEGSFFPWVVSDAVKQLTEQQHFLTRFDSHSIATLRDLTNVSRISFYVNTKALAGEGNERVKTRIINIAKLVDRYSNPENSDMLGKHLEGLVKAELRAQGFNVVGEHDNKYNGKEWTATGHDLDFIVELPNTSLAIGVEVKNTLDLMQTDEIDIKIDICNTLGIVPVFAVRWIKPYIECIRKQNGFSWVFKTQIYPLGQQEMVKDLYSKLSDTDRIGPTGHILEWPITVRTDLPPKSVSKFHDWIMRVNDNPPPVDTSFRCSQRREREPELLLEPEFLP